jgi:biotin operon repressor
VNWCSGAEKELVSLLRGSGRAISAPELAAALGSTDRQVRAMINHLRKDHRLPICSTPAEGFYWPRSRAHAMHTLAQLESRRKELEAVMEGILEGLDREFGPQLVLDVGA